MRTTCNTASVASLYTSSTLVTPAAIAYTLTPATSLNAIHSTALPSSVRAEVVGPRGQELCVGASKPSHFTECVCRDMSAC